MSRFIRLLLIACCLPLAAACTGTSAALERPLDGGTLRPMPADLGPEAMLQAMIASLPRFGPNRDYLVYEEDLLMTETELRAHLGRMSQLKDSPRRDLETQRTGRCIKCYDFTLCDPQLRQELQLTPDHSPTTLCATKLRERVANKRFDPDDATNSFRQIRQVLKGSHVDVSTVDRMPDRARLNMNAARPDRFRDYDEPAPPKKPRPEPRGEVSLDSGPEGDLADYIRVGKKYYTSQTILGVINLLPITCKISTWVKQPEVAAAKITPAEITYAIDQASFDGHYPTVREKMHEAAQGWAELCGDCLFKFVHREELDAKVGLKPGSDAAFIVRNETASAEQAKLLALSFFPNDVAERRYLRVFKSAFASSYPLAALLRHELGHILGLRHEHLRQQAGCIINSLKPSAIENPYWVPFTRYDSMSIMHYACGLSPFDRVAFSSGDKETIRALYETGDLHIDQSLIRRELEREPGAGQAWARCEQFIRDAQLGEVVRNNVQEATRFR